MSVSAVQKNNNLGQMNYLGSMSVGAISGYALKWALPINSSEKNDEKYVTELNQIKKDARLAKIKEFESIGKDFIKSTGIDEFIHMFDDEKLPDVEAKGLESTKQPLPENLSQLFKRINDAGNEAKELGIKKLNHFTKGIRSTAAFVLIGAGVALGIALIHNISARTTIEPEDMP